MIEKDPEVKIYTQFQSIVNRLVRFSGTWGGKTGVLGARSFKEVAKTQTAQELAQTIRINLTETFTKDSTAQKVGNIQVFERTQSESQCGYPQPIQCSFGGFIKTVPTERVSTP